MEQAINGKIVTFETDTAIVAYRFVKGDKTLCGAGEKSYGVTRDAQAFGTLSVVITGEALVELGGTVAAGVEVESDATGCAVTLSTGKVNGVTRDGGGAGDKVRIVVR